MEPAAKLAMMVSTNLKPSPTRCTHLNSSFPLRRGEYDGAVTVTGCFNVMRESGQGLRSRKTVTVNQDTVWSGRGVTHGMRRGEDARWRAASADHRHGTSVSFGRQRIHSHGRWSRVKPNQATRWTLRYSQLAQRRALRRIGRQIGIPWYEQVSRFRST